LEAYRGLRSDKSAAFFIAVDREKTCGGVDGSLTALEVIFAA
jgi:hypothetical protein